MMKVERELVAYETLVLEYLLDKGYPRNAILLEGQLDSRRYVDFIITDIGTGLPLMMIEVKSCGERTKNGVKKTAFESLKRYYTKSSTPIKAVAAIYDRDKGELAFVDFTEAIKENNYDRIGEVLRKTEDISLKGSENYE